MPSGLKQGEQFINCGDNRADNVSRLRRLNFFEAFQNLLGRNRREAMSFDLANCGMTAAGTI
jgi:hypothetical protein